MITKIAAALFTSSLIPQVPLEERCFQHDTRILSSLVDTVLQNEENTMCEYRVGNPTFPLVVSCFTKTSISFIAFKMARDTDNMWHLCEWVETESEFMNPWIHQQ